MEEMRDPWALESGLPNDVDAWMWNCRFGTKDQYVEAVTVVEGQPIGGVPGLMFIVDLCDDKGELLGSQGWSVGSGWVPSEDGKSIHHPARLNVVDNSRYGQLQKRVLKELGVDMRKQGVPTNAGCWNGMGFHWMMEEHPTIKGQELKRGLMPTIFISRKPPEQAPVTPAAAPGTPAGAPPGGQATGDIEAQLNSLVNISPNVEVFQKAALKIEAVTRNDNLMSQVLDVGPTGYFAQHKKG